MKTIVAHSNYAILNQSSNMLRGVGHKTVIDFLHQMLRLNEIAKSRGLQFISSENFSIESIDGFIFIDCPDPNDLFYIKALQTNKPLFLMVWESDLVNSNNHNSELHKSFDVIFTYDDSIVDNVKFYKIAYNFDFTQRKTYQGDPFGRELLCLISSNNYSDRSGELYSMRRKLINWYSNNNHESFHLYGVGWGKIVPPKIFWHRVYNKLSFIHPVLSSYNKCYRGEVDNKIDIGLNYKFQICFENSSLQTGYVSEKLFHALFSDSVPVYLGAPNISDLVPSNCFVDFRQFRNCEELHQFISGMDRGTYMNYLDCARSFLTSKAAEMFDTEYFGKTVSNIILKTLCDLKSH